MAAERTDNTALYGMLAEFDTPEELVAAAQKAYAAGYRKLDAYSPFPVHGLAEAVGFHSNRLPLIVLICGLLGAAGGMLMEYYASAVSYPLNVGGKPFNSWPAFVPVAFETTILLAAFGAVFGMLALNGLPQPYHPLFNAKRFVLASRNRFFLCIEAADPKFDRAGTRRFLEGLEAHDVVEVEE